MMISSTTAQAAPAAQPEPRLVKAAHEFEGQLMKELLRPMVRAFSIAADPDSGSGGTMTDFAAEALGQALSIRGGLGIADRILRDVGANPDNPRPDVGRGGGELDGISRPDPVLK
jgi:Rod binding domain-containing protein